MSLYDYLPEHIKSSVLQEILTSCDPTVEQLKQDLETTKAELFVKSATAKGVGYWEGYLGIKYTNNIPLQQRQYNILSKINIARSCTLDAIETLANNWNCGTVDVTENYSSYTVNIEFVDLGIPSNLVLFEKNLRELLPAHLAYTLQFNFSSWNDHKAKTWGTVKANTWDFLRSNK